MSEPPSWVLLGLCPAGPFLTSPPSLLTGAPSLRSVSYSTKVFSHAFSHHFGCTRRPCCCPGPQLSPHLAACGDALEVAAFNASSWWQEVDTLGQERSWAAERAALGTPSPSWAAEPSTDTAWLELDLGTRRNVTGQLVDGAGCCPHAAWITAQLGCLSPVQTAQRGCRSPPPPQTCDFQESLGAPLATPCSGCTGANWDPDSIGPSWLFPVLIFFLPHCSHFWDEQVNIMLLHLVPASAFCSAKPAANGGFVQRPAGRKWGHCETGGRRREECSRGLSAPWGRVGDVGAQEGALGGLG